MVSQVIDITRANLRERYTVCFPYAKGLIDGVFGNTKMTHPNADHYGSSTFTHSGEIERFMGIIDPLIELRRIMSLHPKERLEGIEEVEVLGRQLCIHAKNRTYKIRGETDDYLWYSLMAAYRELSKVGLRQEVFDHDAGNETLRQATDAELRMLAKINELGVRNSNRLTLGVSLYFAREMMKFALEIQTGNFEPHDYVGSAKFYTALSIAATLEHADVKADENVYLEAARGFSRRGEFKLADRHIEFYKSRSGFMSCESAVLDLFVSYIADIYIESSRYEKIDELLAQRRDILDSTKVDVYQKAYAAAIAKGENKYVRTLNNKLSVLCVDPKVDSTPSTDVFDVDYFKNLPPHKAMEYACSAIVTPPKSGIKSLISVLFE